MTTTSLLTVAQTTGLPLRCSRSLRHPRAAVWLPARCGSSVRRLGWRRLVGGDLAASVPVVSLTESIPQRKDRPSTRTTGQRRRGAHITHENMRYTARPAVSYGAAGQFIQREGQDMASTPLLTDDTVNAAWEAATGYDELRRMILAIASDGRVSPDELHALAAQLEACNADMRAMVLCAERAHVSLQLVQTGLRGSGRPHPKLLRAARDARLPVTIIDPDPIDNLLKFPIDASPDAA